MKDIQTLQNHINKKAKEQALQEWKEFQEQLAGWFVKHPAGFAKITRDEAGYLSTFPLAIPSLDDGLSEFGKRFVVERTAVLAEQHTQELVAKLTVLAYG